MMGRKSEAVTSAWGVTPGSAHWDGLRSRLDDPGSAAGRTGRSLGRSAAAMGTAARAPGQLRPRPLQAAAAFVSCCLRFFVVLFGRPPDEPERPQNRDLQYHEQEEDGPEPRHGFQCRERAQPSEVAQASSAATWPSSSPSSGSVGTNSVGHRRCSAQR